MKVLIELHTVLAIVEECLSTGYSMFHMSYIGLGLVESDRPFGVAGSAPHYSLLFHQPYK